ncbi:MAG: tRNA pseudouridine(55) synthase TruB [Campylobacterales bacterium]|nr:tRNA pseudouridine(55) synthase TruB [Campylobacterales bacterium]
MHDRLFVAYKPAGMSSNQFLGRLKRRYKVKKAGYSGTLDPFAKGVLIVAFGGHTRLFRFLRKTPKRYRATLWLGAHSDTLDIEGVTRIDDVTPLHVSQIEAALKTLEGSLTYTPPAFCAKHVDGQRAYDLARAGREVALEPITSQIDKARLLHYCHPFVTFEATVSEGTYIRSLGALVCARLGVSGGALSALERLNEGVFGYNGETPIDIKTVLDLPQNHFLGELKKLELGQKLRADEFALSQEGTYWIDAGASISIISIAPEGVQYILNKVSAC